MCVSPASPNSLSYARLNQYDGATEYWVVVREIGKEQQSISQEEKQRTATPGSQALAIRILAIWISCTLNTVCPADARRAKVAGEELRQRRGFPKDGQCPTPSRGCAEVECGGHRSDVSTVI